MFFEKIKLVAIPDFKFIKVEFFSIASELAINKLHVFLSSVNTQPLSKLWDCMSWESNTPLNDQSETSDEWHKDGLS